MKTMTLVLCAVALAALQGCGTRDALDRLTDVYEEHGTDRPLEPSPMGRRYAFLPNGKGCMAPAHIRRSEAQAQILPDLRPYFDDFMAEMSSRGLTWSELHQMGHINTLTYDIPPAIAQDLDLANLLGLAWWKSPPSQDGSCFSYDIFIRRPELFPSGYQLPDGSVDPIAFRWVVYHELGHGALAYGHTSAAAEFGSALMYPYTLPHPTEDELAQALDDLADDVLAHRP